MKAKPTIATAVLRFALRFAEFSTKTLDWMVSVMERIIVLGVGSSVLCLGYRLVRGDATRASSELLTIINQNWKAFLLLLIPLFYQTIRKFLEEVEEAYGMKRHRLKGSAGREEARED